jgi:O-acetyl-ADP-ribose deacetylase (regulator of RNase III)
MFQTSEYGVIFGAFAHTHCFCCNGIYMGGENYMDLQVVRGDITKRAVDAIVNAANSSLLGGGGVDGAIHRAAGPELLEACRQLHGCKTGDAKATAGFKLPAKWIFHAVGPVWSGGKTGEADDLVGCYRKCLRLAQEHGVKSIAFPAISTGVYHYPKAEAAGIAVRVCREMAESCGVEQIEFVCFDEATAVEYEKQLKKI